MQDIQFALASQNPLRLTLSPFDERLQLMWTHRVSQTDRDWAHRAVWLLAGSINYCYGGRDPHASATERNMLKQKINAWEARKPDGFRPLHFSLADSRIGRPYPVVWYTKPLYGKPLGAWLIYTPSCHLLTKTSNCCATYLPSQSFNTGVRAPEFVRKPESTAGYQHNRGLFALFKAQ